MNKTKIVLRSGENKITEYCNDINTISDEEIQIAKYLRDTLEIHKEEIRCQRIDTAVDRFSNRSSKYINVDRCKKRTLKDLLYDFICGFELFDVLALLAWLGVWMYWWWR